MDTNPLFPQNDTPSQDSGIIFEHKQNTQHSQHPEPTGAKTAADIIREKLARIYAEEPNSVIEKQEALVARTRSKHQQFMYELSTSGRSLAEIQTAWHNYYAGLPDAEKHEVWREFYESKGMAVPKQHLPAQTAKRPQESKPEVQHTITPTAASLPQVAVPTQPALPSLKKRLPELPTLESLTPAALRAGQLSRQLAQHAHRTITPQAKRTVAGSRMVFGKIMARLRSDARKPEQIRESIRENVAIASKLKVKHHLQSLAFGLSVGVLTIIIFLFSFFNEVVIAPFIQPARTVSATPIIIDPSNTAPTTQPEIIIPKINLEIPVDFTQTSNSEDVIQSALNNGIVHYPSTVFPGQNGNAAFFGHSSNNILNPGKYKFAFVLLHEIQPGDIFYVSYNGKMYVYKVFSRQIVDPNDVEVLNSVAGHPATATLITCDPPGTIWHRLVVIGDQVSPDPSVNTVTPASTTPVQATQLPGNGPSLWDRIWHSVF